MNLNSILQSLDSCGYFGHIISVEESIILHNSLLILQNENHFRQIFFWGKILGTEKDYYIAYGYSRDILYGKVYYYSRNCTDWGLLPKPTKNGLILTPLCTTKFQGEIIRSYIYRFTKQDKSDFFIGDPSLVIDVLIDKDETFIPGKRKQPELRKLKEEDRLASTVHQIMDEAGTIPRGALFKQSDGIVVENLSFEGLSTLESREIKSFLHFRPPTRKQNSNLLTRDDYNYAMDFLDPLDIDLPEGCWMIQITPAEDLVILKSIHWPGLMSYHFCKTPKHGFIYIGHGKKSLDTPFMLSPFCM